MKLVNKIFYAAGAVFILGNTSLIAEEMSPKEIISKAQEYLGSLDKEEIMATTMDTLF